MFSNLKNSFTRKSALTIALCLLITLAADAAQQPQQMSERVFEQGAVKFSKKDLPGAVRSFIQALLLNPEYRPAQSMLRQMSRDKHNFGTDQRLQISRFLGLIDTLDFAQKYIRQVHAQNITLIQFIQKNAAEDHDYSGLQTEIQPLQALNELYEVQTVFNSQWKQSDFQLTRINEQLSIIKNDRLDLLKKIQDIHCRLWKKKQDIILATAQERQIDLSTAFTNKIHHLEKRFQVQQQRLNQQDSLIGTLTRQLNSMQQNYSALQLEYLKLTRQSNSSTQQLAKVSLELFDKDRILADQIQQNNLLKDQILDIEQRTSLTQEILREKDQQINALMSQLAKDPAMQEASAVLPATMGPVNQQPDRLRSMEREIHQLRRQYEMAARHLKKQDRRIQELERALSTRDLTIAEMQRTFMQQQTRLSELNGILAIYKLKLSKAQQPTIDSAVEAVLTTNPSVMRKQFVDRNLPLHDRFGSMSSDQSVYVIDPRIPLGNNRDLIYHRTKQRIMHLIQPGGNSNWLIP